LGSVLGSGLGSGSGSVGLAFDSFTISVGDGSGAGSGDVSGSGEGSTDGSGSGSGSVGFIVVVVVGFAWVGPTFRFNLGVTANVVGDTVTVLRPAETIKGTDISSAMSSIRSLGLSTTGTDGSMLLTGVGDARLPDGAIGIHPSDPLGGLKPGLGFGNLGAAG
jgi:hypothetical protein